MQLDVEKHEMKTTSNARMIKILTEACHSEEQRPQLIAEFQNAVWNAPDDDSWESELLDELAYNLEFYQPNADLRAEDESYIDDSQAVMEIKLVLEKLKAN